MNSHDTACPSREEALRRRIRGEYLEMPGLHLTLWQASRLWGIDADTCRRLLATLMAEGFLKCTCDGSYACRCHTSR